jgi:hypothetical protein
MVPQSLASRRVPGGDEDDEDLVGRLVACQLKRDVAARRRLILNGLKLATLAAAIGAGLWALDWSWAQAWLESAGIDAAAIKAWLGLAPASKP